MKVQADQGLIIYIERETDRQTDRKIDRYIQVLDRQTKVKGSGRGRIIATFFKIKDIIISRHNDSKS